MGDSILQKLVGKKVKAARKQRELSQEQLGDRTGYSDSAISAFERGDRNISLIAAFSLADELGVSVEEFRPSSGNDSNPFDY